GAADPAAPPSPSPKKGKTVPPKVKAGALIPPDDDGTSGDAAAAAAAAAIASVTVSDAEKEQMRRDALADVFREIYREKAPERVAQVDSILRDYRSKEAELFTAVEEKYGLAKGHIAKKADEVLAKKVEASLAEKRAAAAAAAAAAGASGPKAKALRDAKGTARRILSETLNEFFAEVAPEKVGGGADALMRQYEGREAELFKALEAEHRKPAGFIKGRVQAKTAEAASAIASQGSAESALGAGKKKAGAAATVDGDDVWVAIQKADQQFRQGSGGGAAGASGVPQPTTVPVFSFREQLEYLCDRYCPPRAAMIDAALRAYHGREVELISKMHATYGVTNANEYLPPRREVPPSAAESLGGETLERIPPPMKGAAELARHFGLGPHFVPKIIEQHGRADDRFVLFETLAAVFPDAVCRALSDERQKTAFVARRIANFLSFHNPKARHSIGRLVQRYADMGRVEDALGDLLIRFYGPLLESVPVKSFDAADLTDDATAGLQETRSAAMSAVFAPSSGATPPVLSPQPTLLAMPSSALVGAPESVLRRREFLRSCEEWSTTYGPGSATSRSTPRYLGR
ncbi:MAG: hypothetical protein Q8S13_06030, partial [Dehalococcoidia bacterium]|nr:hypothetical protein [Dehalococcoidia bacterium]